ncbi:MAG: Fe-S cluster assembly protein SufD [Bacteroidia bacterium]|nr:Fe-S cluster assembly protein SufD [Bacteroidia bacterium]
MIGSKKKSKKMLFDKTTIGLLEDSTGEIMEETSSSSISETFSKIRQAALSHFNLNGYPGKKHEDYKYMRLDAISDTEFKTGCTKAAEELTYDDIKKYVVNEAEKNIMVLANGRYSILASKLELPEGVIAGSILDHIDHPALAKYFSKIEAPDSNGFSAANTAGFVDGLFLFIPKGVVLEDPIQILKLTDSKERHYNAHNRSLFVIEENAKAHVVETSYSVGDFKAFNNSVTEIHCETNSELKFSKIQNEDASSFLIDNTSISQRSGSKSRVNTISLGSNITRNNLNITLNGEHCDAELFGFYVSKDDQQIDNHTLVNHNSANCESTELYKGLADDKSISTFNGKIFVKRDAQKTNAFQSNKNILLDDNATINTKPQLEIYADDVKCSHGATIGQMDEEALFYLRSRGIALREAQLLMIRAFAADVLDKIGIESVERSLRALIDEKLRN